MGIPAITLALQAGSAVAGGVAGMNSAKAAKQQAEINSDIGRTRAAQSDTAARDGLNSEMAGLRTTLAANMQRPGVGTGEINREFRDTRGRERRIEYGNRMQESADYGRQAKNAGVAGRGELLGGLLKAGPSLFDLYDLKKRK
jgi:hypothetical protein